MLKSIVVFSVATLFSGLSLAGTSNCTSSLPLVDLGYEIHQANSYNATGDYYNFSNIRYAAPPTGEKRFRLPVSPSQNRTNIQTGSVGSVCPQVLPAWVFFSLDWIGNYIEGQALGVTQADLNALNASITPNTISTMDARTTEDCLFLDIITPKNVFDKRNSTGAPVLVWLHGGGYVVGDKTNDNPAGLIKRSQGNGQDGIIFVSLNYRLGVFGWLGGPTLQADGVANAGLHDQRFAMAWIQKYIHLFGGDPSRVTIMGESAGGGSVLHHLTAHGGAVKPHFSQAILQSPAWRPVSSNYEAESAFEEFLRLTNLSSLDQLRAAPTQVLIDANFLQVFHSTYSSFTYGPIVDGSFIPALPSILFLEGRFSKDVRVMAGHNADEGLFFTNPFVQTESNFTDYIMSSFPDASPAVLMYIEEVMYPAVYNGTYSYTDPIGRSALAISEFLITCNTYFLDTAFHNKTYAYLFDVFPGLHAQDIGFTYYLGGAPTPSIAGLPYNTTIAFALQDYIVTFVESGIPTALDVPESTPFGTYSKETLVQDLSIYDIGRRTDPAANERCRWWQEALYI